MKILSHRGMWIDKEEQNSEIAFKRSFSSGFGVETDVRDYQKKLVISHDIPSGNELNFDDFLEVYKSEGQNSLLALNIKSDGLQKLLRQSLYRHKVNNYFVFDTSVPDGLGYIEMGMITYTRQSEYETFPSFYKKASGVWLDEFHGQWIDETTLQNLLSDGKEVCIVSPELHGRSFLQEWALYKEFESFLGVDSFAICTDFPKKAERYFNG